MVPERGQLIDCLPLSGTLIDKEIFFFPMQSDRLEVTA
jgi:hypothetical protein